jgi:hypothetical protein
MHDIKYFFSIKLIKQFTEGQKQFLGGAVAPLVYTESAPRQKTNDSLCILKISSQNVKFKIQPIDLHH